MAWKRGAYLAVNNLRGCWPWGVLVLALIVPGLAAQEARAADKDTVVMGMWSSPGNSLLPHFYSLGYARAVFRIVFSPLLEWNDEGQIVPRMAESYEISAGRPDLQIQDQGQRLLARRPAGHLKGRALYHPVSDRP